MRASFQALLLATQIPADLLMSFLQATVPLYAHVLIVLHGHDINLCPRHDPEGGEIQNVGFGSHQL
jgi:hypothetical protein